ncbi:MAG TPA: SLBB domain-containing protein [Longimicrobium sp.]
MNKTRVHRRAGRRPAAAALALVAGCLLATLPRPGSLAAQTGADTARARAGAPAAAAVQIPSLPLPAGPLLDAPVSRAEYRLGAGDVVDVAIFGDYNRVERLPVTPEGTLVVAELGVARVLGLNLDQAEERVRALVYRFYRNVDVTLTLSQVRTFKVFVVGDVAQPGVRAASAVTRVSEIVPPISGGGTGAEVHRRNVVLRRASGDSVPVDLARFLQAGDLSANPTLREGDALVVPTIDRTVQVYGRVQFPGIYEYRPGETLAEFLAVANGGGGFPANAADSIRLSRFVSAGARDIRTLPREAAFGPEGRALVLQPFDAIFVPALANYMVQRTATVLGQVVRPGTYPIRHDTTTVRELVAMAGGFTPEASLVDATLTRQPPPTQGEAVRRLQAIPPELLSDDERRILQVRLAADPTVVVLDFQRLFAEGNDALDQPLQSGDVLTVPVRRTGVTVLGAVLQPGIVPYAPGRDVHYYVNLAGGYSRRADWKDTEVLRARSGSRADLREVRAVDAGDQIVVPFARRRDPLQTLQTLQGVVTVVTGLLLTAFSIERIF